MSLKLPDITDMREMFFNLRAAAENYLAPNVTSIRVLGCSKTVE